MMKFKLYIFIVTCILKTSSSFCQGTWTQKADFAGMAKSGVVGFSIGKKGYIGAGYSGLYPNFTYYNEFWEWDQSTNTWTQKASFGSMGRSGAVGFSIGLRGYIGTGRDIAGNLHQDFWEWDQATNTWTQISDFGGGPRSNGIGFSIGNKGYIGYAWIQDLWEWNQATDTWTQMANFSGDKRYYETGFSIGNKGYMGLGGNGALPVYSDFWEWDPNFNSWTQKANFPGYAKWNATGFSVGACGFIGTGWQGSATGGNSSNEFWKWDQSTNIWTQVASCGDQTQTRYGAIGFSIGNNGYIGLGINAYYNNVYTYTPLTSFWEYCDTCSAVSITENKNKISMSVFPNPFSVRTTFTFREHVTGAFLKIYSVSGQEIKTIFFSGKQLIVERENLLSGIYFYQIIFGDHLAKSGKLIIQ